MCQAARPAWAQPKSKAKVFNVAVLTAVDGTVEVRHALNRYEQAVKGNTLNEGDEILTAKRGGVSVLFRDGSRLRVGAQTNLTIRRVEELWPQTRRFRIYLYLKKGTLWGRFTRFITPDSRMEFPSGKVGLRQAVFRILQTAQWARVASSEVSLMVENVRGRVQVPAGWGLRAFHQTHPLKSRLTLTPFQLDISLIDPHKPLLHGPEDQRFIDLQIRLLNRQGNTIYQSGYVHLYSDHQFATPPSRINLNPHRPTTVRVPIRLIRGVSPPPDGVLIRAIWEGANPDLIREGRALLPISVNAVSRDISLSIDAIKGSAKRQK